MDFNHFLTSYMPDPTVGSKKHFQNMIDQAVLAEKLGYFSVYIPEHHLVNILMMPSPLQMAVKLATLTKKINLVTSVAVLPLHDMRTYAGEVATADILTGGRLILGVARGAFAWEMERLGSPPDGEGRTRYLSSDERSEVLACLGGIEELSDKVSPIKRELIFLLYCGARLSEMRTLLWGAVDEDSVVLVSIKGNKRKKKTRRVPLHHRVVNTLGVRGEPTELVFTKGGGNMWDKTAFYHEFHKVMSCAGISDFTPHDCRHTFASHLVMGGADLRTVAELLGHSTMSMVMRYSHLSRGHLEDAIKKL